MILSYCPYCREIDEHGTKYAQGSSLLVAVSKTAETYFQGPNSMLMSMKTRI